jgi:hypothetical protein
MKDPDDPALARTWADRWYGAQWTDMAGMNQQAQKEDG